MAKAVLGCEYRTTIDRGSRRARVQPADELNYKGVRLYAYAIRRPLEANVVSGRPTAYSVQQSFQERTVELTLITADSLARYRLLTSLIAPRPIAFVSTLDADGRATWRRSRSS